MSGTSTIKQFQTHIWDSLPLRKTVVGREVVDDFVIAAIQLWPVTELSQSDRGSPERIELLDKVASDVRRMLTVVYGGDRFEAFWRIGMRSLALAILELMDDWWSRRKDNRAKIIIWRRKWVSNDE